MEFGSILNLMQDQKWNRLLFGRGFFVVNGAEQLGRDFIVRLAFVFVLEALDLVGHLHAVAEGDQDALGFDCQIIQLDFIDECLRLFEGGSDFFVGNVLSADFHPEVRMRRPSEIRLLRNDQLQPQYPVAVRRRTGR